MLFLLNFKICVRYVMLCFCFLCAAALVYTALTLSLTIDTTCSNLCSCIEYQIQAWTSLHCTDHYTALVLAMLCALFKMCVKHAQHVSTVDMQYSTDCILAWDIGEIIDMQLICLKYDCLTEPGDKIKLLQQVSFP